MTKNPFPFLLLFSFPGLSKAELAKKKREERRQQREKEIREKRAARKTAGALKLGVKKGD